jgi:ATP-dependent Clp protease ATP-binding subunit ClpC
MYEKFTIEAKRVIITAQSEAVALGHDFIGTEHVLLGLVGVEGSVADEVLSVHAVTAARAREETVRILTDAGVANTGGQPMADALATLGIDVEQIRRRADETFGPGRFVYPRPPFTTRAKSLLERSLREAVALGHDHVGPEHLLLGLIGDAEGVAARTLTALHVDPIALRPEILALLAPAGD